MPTLKALLWNLPNSGKLSGSKQSRIRARGGAKELGAKARRIASRILLRTQPTTPMGAKAVFTMMADLDM